MKRLLRYHQAQGAYRPFDSNADIRSESIPLDTPSQVSEQDSYSHSRTELTPSPVSSRIQSPAIPIPYYSTRDLDHGHTEYGSQASMHKNGTFAVRQHGGGYFPEPTHTKNSSEGAIKRHGVLDNLGIWWLEILACFLATGALFAIIGTVYPHQGLPIPKWPYNLSINTLVSIYVIVLKAALVAVVSSGLGQLKWTWFRDLRPLKDVGTFDDASRGFAGSFALLWTLRGRGVVASLGAVITILATIIDPFGQQLVHFYQCSSIDLTVNATIDNSNFVSVGRGNHNGAGRNAILLDMQAAISVAIFDKKRSQVNVDCPSGNCTFTGTYKTAAHCSKCDDITSLLNITHYGDDNRYENFTLPGGLTASPFNAEAFVMAGAGYEERILVQAIFGYTDNFSASDDMQNCEDPNSWGCRGYGAAGCVVYPCVQTLSASVDVGNLTETLISNASNWGDSQGGWYSTIDISCLIPAERDSILQLGYILPQDAEWLAYNLSGYAEDYYDPGLTNDDPSILNHTMTNVRPDCIYQFFIFDYASLGDYFNILFSGELPYAPEADGYGPIILQQILDGGAVSYASISATMDNVANAMTVFSRSQSPMLTNGTFVGRRAIGEVHKSDTCVGVRWEWLSFPAALTLFTLVFFACMAAQTRWKDREVSVYDYKTGALPLLYHGLEKSTQEKLGFGVQKTSDLDKQARNIYVRLEDQDGRYKFVEVR